MNGHIYITKISCWLYANIHFVVHMTIAEPIIFSYIHITKLFAIYYDQQYGQLHRTYT